MCGIHSAMCCNYIFIDFIQLNFDLGFCYDKKSMLIETRDSAGYASDVIIILIIDVHHHYEHEKK